MKVMENYRDAWQHGKYPPLFISTSVNNCCIVFGQFNLGTRKIVSFLAGNKSGDNQGLDPSPEVTTFQWSIVIQLKLSNF